MNFLHFESLLFKECAKCQECCHVTPVCLCGFQVLEAIELGKIPDEIVNQLVLYRINDDDLDIVAKSWWHFSTKNILRLITISEENHFDFLVLPRTRGPCAFSNSKGCAFPVQKPFNCAIFPFYLNNTQFTVASWCPLNNISNTTQLKELELQCRQIYQKYEIFCFKNQKNYFQILQKLHKRYKWRMCNYK